MRSRTFMMRSPVLAFWRGSSFTVSTICWLLGSPTSSGVTIQGPSTVKVSSDLRMLRSS